MSNVAAASGLALVTLFMIVSLLTVNAGQANAPAHLAQTASAQIDG